MEIYTVSECYALLEEYGTPVHVIAHCEAVSQVGLRVGKALNAKGHNLDLALIEAAGLLHDIARVEPAHDQVGAQYLRQRGHDREADIVAVHMYYDHFNAIGDVDEADIVCLADRVCKENRYVGLEERMNYILDKAKDNPKALKIIRRKKKEVAEFIAQLEERIGCSLDELVDKE